MNVIEGVATRWENIATRLNFDMNQIEHISRTNHFQAEDACRAVFSEWLKGKEGLRLPITWKTLIRALEEAGLGQTAWKLRTMIGEVKNIMGQSGPCMHMYTDLVRSTT